MGHGWLVEKVTLTQVEKPRAEVGEVFSVTCWP